MQMIDQKTLYEIEARCTQQQPPPAMAGCPLHVECRAVCEAVSKGDFSAALELYAKVVPLPRTLSALCTAPCMAVCARKDLGGAIDMRAIEEAAVREGTRKARRSFLPRRSDTAAVIGGGVSGVTAALELGKKGVHVTLFERSDALGGTLKADEAALACFAADCAVLADYPIEIQYHTNMEPENAADFDAVILAMGADAPVEIIEDTGEVEAGGRLFACGACANPDAGVLCCIAGGKKAATSVDRYLKKVNLRYGREQEGPFTTTLYVKTEGVEPQGMAAGEKDADWAKAEAARCIQCTCMRCVDACAFLQHYKTYPRQFTREVVTNISMSMGNRTANTAINSCSLCGQCEKLCPGGMNLGALLMQSRAVMAATNHMPQWPFDFALDDLADSNGPSYLAKPAPGSDTCKYLFFPGCQLGASAPELVKRVFDDLLKRESQTGILLGCCGIGALWAGREQLFADTQEKLKAEWARLGKPKLIVACPTCMKTLEWADCIGIWDILLETLPIEHIACDVCVHDACGARDMPAVRDAVRELLHRMGCIVTEQKYSGATTGCCGFGGYTQYANPEVANEAAALAAPDGAMYLTYCMNCRDRFSKNGGKAVHILELAYGMAEHEPPTYSQRRDNRERLRLGILKDVYGEEEKPWLLHFPLYYSEDVAKKLEERLILEQHIREAVEAAERTNDKLLHGETGLFIAHKRIGHITVWVYYHPEKDGYQVERAYSHRMEVRV
ncbi:MAG: FAD-dependent oxidoreductase [Clostridia bacterium]|nr:FAD-dependent oxidoreductase [Clostridia bacterium]